MYLVPMLLLETLVMGKAMLSGTQRDVLELTANPTLGWLPM
jgi:hypothetical protein